MGGDNITGALHHEAGSIDVKIEGCGAVRHLDLTTGNHSNTSNAVPSVEGATVDTSAAAKQECKELSKNNEATRNDLNALSSDKRIVGHDEEGACTTGASMDAGSLRTTTRRRRSGSTIGLRQAATPPSAAARRRRSARGAATSTRRPPGRNQGMPRRA